MLFKLTKLSGKAKILVLAVIVVVLCLFILVGIVGNSNAFRKGVRIEEIDVSGLDKMAAKVRLMDNLDKKYGSSTFSLIAGEKTYKYGLGDISYNFLVDGALNNAFQNGRSGGVFHRISDSINLLFNSRNTEIENSFDTNKLNKILEEIKAQIDLEPQSATMKYQNGKIQINKDTPGRTLDIDNNRKLVENLLVRRNFDNIPLQIENIEADITYDEIKVIDSVISEFQTNFSLNDANRSDNIRLAASKLDGMILMPGQEFSMNEALGPRTTKNGYKEAPVIFKNELIPGTGGGVCQVSTTLYNAVLKAMLKVVERSPHSLPLAYVQAGQDATIAEGSIDFKFNNNKEYPIYISAVVKGGTIKIQLLGRKEAEKRIVKLRSETVEIIPPEPDEIEIDDTLPDGEKVVVKKARNGIRSVLYRETYSADNVLINKEIISKDYYKPSKGLIKINTNYLIFLTVEGYLDE